MTTLEQLVVTWVYVYVRIEEDHALDGYIQRPGFLIGDRISIDHLTVPTPCVYGPDDVAIGYESAGWYIALLGRLIVKVETLEIALIAANALDELVQQNRIHGKMVMRGDELIIELDDTTVATMHEAVVKALAA